MCCTQSRRMSWFVQIDVSLICPLTSFTTSFCNKWDDWTNGQEKKGDLFRALGKTLECRISLYINIYCCSRSIQTCFTSRGGNCFVYIYIYTNIWYLFSVHVICPCKAQVVLESTRGAAKHKGCCKAQGVLQNTRVAAKNMGCFLVDTHKFITYIYVIYIYIYLYIYVIYIYINIYMYNMYFSIYVYVYLGRNNCSQQIAPNEVYIPIFFMHIYIFIYQKKCYIYIYPLNAHVIWSCACFKAPESEAIVRPLDIATPKVNYIYIYSLGIFSLLKLLYIYNNIYIWFLYVQLLDW